MFTRLLTMLLLLTSLAGCSSAPSPLHRAEFTRLCMGVPTRIVLFAENPESARDSAAAAFARIADLEQVMSDYRPDSELMRLRAAPAGTPVPISPDLHDVLSTSQQLATVSSGAFDITLGPAIALWRRARTTRQLPTPDELAAARAISGPHLLTLTDSPPTATLAKPNMKLDLGGIGKGYAAQAAADLLRTRGHPRCLVALAGDIVVGDPPPDAPGWSIELALPEAGGWGEGDGRAMTSRQPHAAYAHEVRILLSNAAISTSGSTEQFVEIDGRRYAHIIDPRTGLGLTEFRLATVIARRGEVADALATIACILPPEQAREVMKHFPGARLSPETPAATGTLPAREIHPAHLPRRGPAPIAR